jgi:hypothetical protein
MTALDDTQPASEREPVPRQYSGRTGRTGGAPRGDPTAALDLETGLQVK